MFYCEECRVKNEWPESISRSTGNCEVCGDGRLCYDRPSSQLPMKKNESEKHVLTIEVKNIDDVSYMVNIKALWAITPFVPVLGFIRNNLKNTKAWRIVSINGVPYEASYWVQTSNNSVVWPGYLNTYVVKDRNGHIHTCSVSEIQRCIAKYVESEDDT